METGLMTSLLVALTVAVALQFYGAHAQCDDLKRTALSPEDYFASLVDQFDDAVRSLGLYNLPVQEFTKELNETVNNICLEGNCTYSFGYVIDIDPFLVGKDSWGTSISYFDGYLQGYVDLPYIEVTYDFQAALTVDSVSGIATHRYPNNRILVVVQRNATTQGSTPEASVYVSSVSSANYTVYLPSTNVTEALARVARFESGYTFWYVVEAWCNLVFPSILQQIVDTMEFPL